MPSLSHRSPAGRAPTQTPILFAATVFASLPKPAAAFWYSRNCVQDPNLPLHRPLLVRGRGDRPLPPPAHPRPHLPRRVAQPARPHHRRRRGGVGRARGRVRCHPLAGPGRAGAHGASAAAAGRRQPVDAEHVPLALLPSPSPIPSPRPTPTDAAASRGRSARPRAPSKPARPLPVHDPRADATERGDARCPAEQCGCARGALEPPGRGGGGEAVPRWAGEGCDGHGWCWSGPGPGPAGRLEAAGNAGVEDQRGSEGRSAGAALGASLLLLPCFALPRALSCSLLLLLRALFAALFVPVRCSCLCTVPLPAVVMGSPFMPPRLARFYVLQTLPTPAASKSRSREQTSQASSIPSQAQGVQPSDIYSMYTCTTKRTERID
ncbi:hypothetical protein CALCODRAFT_243431 [Calocera cornea HHB12733]|uniref:Uncharacterized protein n=1 Tax=Calocera cornea HHB12733 TaxID=1353952 RepID=A0A165GQH4_9BASI|nr:hypothetical protein CALCODRAFT_243431 [Calocera cornea HHB12733]